MYKKAANETLIGGIEERLNQRLGRGGGAPASQGGTAPIRSNEPVTQNQNVAPTTAQPGAEGTPTQRPFTINGPANASRNATALNMPQQNPNMAGDVPQGAPQQQQIDPLQEAAALDQAAQEAASIGNSPLANQYGNRANQIRKDVRAQTKAEADKEARQEKTLLAIHKTEKAAYDELEKEAKQAKTTSRARDTMIAQLGSGKLNPKNFRNLIANMFKGNPVLEGLVTTPEREVFKSAGISQFEGMKDIFGVRLSDADLAIAATKVMDVTKPIEANLAIAKFWAFSDKMKIQEANIAREVKKENDGFLPINWREQVHERMQERFGDEAVQVTEAAANEGGSRPLKIIEGKIAITTPEGKRKLIPQEQLKQALLAGGIPE